MPHEACFDSFEAEMLEPCGLSAIWVLSTFRYQSMPQSMFIKDEAEMKTLKIFKYKYNGFVSDAIDKYLPDGVFGKVSVNDTLKKVQDEAKAKVEQDQANEKQ